MLQHAIAEQGLCTQPVDRYQLYSVSFVTRLYLPPLLCAAEDEPLRWRSPKPKVLGVLSHGEGKDGENKVPGGCGLKKGLIVSVYLQRFVDCEACQPFGRAEYESPEKAVTIYSESFKTIPELQIVQFTAVMACVEGSSIYASEDIIMYHEQIN
ncbi:unnamed protein product [Linum tenue]|uniref:Uncharacterized protein n=1 Tax=Linum tenue TaxID=586396 RepID=A0AAV0RCE4_9ROSI|nr:unnamed protein product [Linum tenue]